MNITISSIVLLAKGNEEKTVSDLCITEEELDMPEWHLIPRLECTSPQATKVVIGLAAFTDHGADT